MRKSEPRVYRRRAEISSERARGVTGLLSKSGTAAPGRGTRGRLGDYARGGCDAAAEAAAAAATATAAASFRRHE